MQPSGSTVYLVSCVSQKRAQECAARELYVSDLFCKARRYGEASGCPWYILSAEYGLVSPDEVIAPYERTLNTMAVAARRAWAERVAVQLATAVPDVARVVFLAGERYREFLAEHLIRRGVAVSVHGERTSGDCRVRSCGDHPRPDRYKPSGAQRPGRTSHAGQGIVEAGGSAGGGPRPRRQCKNLRHRLVDVLALGFCGVLCGCDDFVEVEEFARLKEDFFRRFLELPHGIPSHDTFRRVFQAACPRALQTCQIQWLQGARQAARPAGGAVVAIDGKALRRTSDRARGLGALRLVSAWATANGLTLGEVAVDAQSNEITAIPQLIELLDLEGCVVTIDAAGCQKDIAGQIVAKGADYVLALKANQPGLYEQVSDHFLQRLAGDIADGKMRRQRQAEEGHGRAVTRETFVAPAPAGMAVAGAWVGLASLVMVVARCADHAAGKSSEEVRYYISSLPAKVKQLAGAVRQHWGIENGLHWVLDVGC